MPVTLQIAGVALTTLTLKPLLTEMVSARVRPTYAVDGAMNVSTCVQRHRLNSDDAPLTV